MESKGGNKLPGQRTKETKRIFAVSDVLGGDREERHGAALEVSEQSSCPTQGDRRSGSNRNAARPDSILRVDRPRTRDRSLRDPLRNSFCYRNSSVIAKFRFAGILVILKTPVPCSSCQKLMALEIFRYASAGRTAKGGYRRQWETSHKSLPDGRSLGFRCFHSAGSCNAPCRVIVQFLPRSCARPGFGRSRRPSSD